MHPSRVRRDRLRTLTDLPNVGPSIARDLRLIGIERPAQLAGRDPLRLYRALSRATGVRQDPCVLDTFISITDFMDGGRPRVWWSFTDARKRKYGDL